MDTEAGAHPSAFTGHNLFPRQFLERHGFSAFEKNTQRMPSKNKKILEKRESKRKNLLNWIKTGIW